MLDTNILLTYLQSLQDLKEALKPFKMSLLIPWIVVEELDGLKVPFFSPFFFRCFLSDYFFFFSTIEKRSGSD